ncbi:MAG: hypothetical protein JRF41_01360 [Deltaproteobacteria bacterium]|nr:hypothetical protein [Deltaproteobacteria bacterium]
MKKQQALDELERRRRIALKMGGEKMIARHRERGRLTARERLDNHAGR